MNSPRVQTQASQRTAAGLHAATLQTSTRACPAAPRGCPHRAARAGSACPTHPASCLPLRQVAVWVGIYVMCGIQLHARPRLDGPPAVTSRPCGLNAAPPQAVRRLAGKHAGLPEAALEHCIQRTAGVRPLTKDAMRAGPEEVARDALPRQQRHLDHLVQPPRRIHARLGGPDLPPPWRRLRPLRLGALGSDAQRGAAVQSKVREQLPKRAAPVSQHEAAPPAPPRPWLPAAVRPALR